MPQQGARTHYSCEVGRVSAGHFLYFAAFNLAAEHMPQQSAHTARGLMLYLAAAPLKTRVVISSMLLTCINPSVAEPMQTQSLGLHINAQLCESNVVAWF